MLWDMGPRALLVLVLGISAANAVHIRGDGGAMPEAPVMASALNALQSGVAKPKQVLSESSMNSETGNADNEDDPLSAKSLGELTKLAHEVLDGKKVLFMGDSCTRQDMGTLMCLIDGSKGLKKEKGMKNGCDVEYFLRHPPPGMSLVQQPNAVNHTSKINEPGGARDHFLAEFSNTKSVFEFMWLPDMGRVKQLLATDGPYDCDNTGEGDDKLHQCHLNDVTEQLRTPGKWDIIFIAPQGGANKKAPTKSNLKDVMHMIKTTVTSGPVIARSNHAEDFETHKGELWGEQGKTNKDIESWVEQEHQAAQAADLTIVDTFSVTKLSDMKSRFGNDEHGTHIATTEGRATVAKVILEAFRAHV